MGSRPAQPAYMRQCLYFGVIDDIHMSAVIPTDVNAKARVTTAKFGHADGISGGLVASERELVAVHVAAPCCDEASFGLLAHLRIGRNPRLPLKVPHLRWRAKTPRAGNGVLQPLIRLDDPQSQRVARAAVNL
jgi:hypothetical protein